jgi:uncharacterized membrane protein
MMRLPGSENRLYRCILLLSILAAIAGLSGVLYHTTHCDSDHGHCHICLLAATLIVVIAAFIVLFIYLREIFRFISELPIYIYLNSSFLARAPPALPLLLIKGT